MNFKPNILQSWEGYTQKLLIKDIFAGITVGVVALPLSMAFAIASGLKPEVGIYTAIIAGFLISIFGGCRVQIGGPAGAFIIIIYGILHDYGLANLLIATGLSGLILVLMGLLKLGNLIKHIPQTVIYGFTNGIAILIGLSQIKDFLGLTNELPADFFGMVREIIIHLPDFKPLALGTSLICLLFLISWRKIRRHIGFVGGVPETFLVLFFATVTAKLWDLPLETIGSRFGGIPDHLPSWTIPQFDSVNILHLLTPILTLAILGAIESLLCAKVADEITNTSHDSNQELLAQGLTNFLLPFFGGMPATGTIARTVTSIHSGGSSPIAGIVHSLTLVLIVCFASQLAQFIPLACLAAILIYVAINMGEWDKLLKPTQFKVSERISIYSVFGLTVVFNLAVGILVGIIWSLITNWHGKKRQ
ncbi:MAG: SulP family inorganic anion transporter [Betaproteobacteria bacterium]